MGDPRAADELTRIARDLSAELEALSFGAPVTHVYDPHAYAMEPLRAYFRLHANAGIEALLLGMNPGPYGMAQTGVPFGDAEMTRDWLGVREPVGHPVDEHPKRPVLGFDIGRREVSGTRIWSWARDHFGQPARFFRRFFVANYCPLCFMEISGRNRTPDKLPAAERTPLFAACDRALLATVRTLRPSMVIGIGAFAEERARSALVDRGLRVGRILHPSPANPRANRDWAGAANDELAALGIEVASR